MHHKTIMITGANAGIGYETTRQLAALGATVVMVCRSGRRGEKARQQIVTETGNKKLHLLQCDLASQANIHQAVSEFKEKFQGLHVLINNAAMYSPQPSVTIDGIETQLAVNYLSVFLLTTLLLEKLKASAPARVINLSTTNHFFSSLDLSDLQSKKHYEPKDVHMRSKLAVILFTYELARRLENTGVTANCLHPGVIATKLLGAVRNVPPGCKPGLDAKAIEIGAKTPVFLATSPGLEKISGKYFDDCHVTPSSDETYDKVAASKLWNLSQQLVKLSGSSR